MSWSLSAADRGAVTGDLCEEFSARAARDGLSAARRWYWRQLRLSVAPNLRRRVATSWNGGAARASVHERAPQSSTGGLMHHMRVAVLALVRRPATPAIIVATLALCIGATTTIFSLVDTLLLRPLPVPHAEQLVTIEGESGDLTPWTYAIWQAFHGRPDLFDGVMAWSPTEMNIATTGEADLVNALWASASFFKVLGVVPEEGRLLTEADDQRGGGPDGFVVVISHAFWIRQFGGDPSAVGRLITLGARRVTIVGVTPPWFFGPDVGRTFDIAMPIGLASPSTLDGRLTWWLNIMARLRPGQTMALGQDALAAAQHEIREQARPDALTGTDSTQFDKEVTFRLRAASTGNSALRIRYGHALVVLLAAVGVVLLVACANVANLMLVRAVSRTHEMSVRVALGASRRQLVGPLLVESGLLAMAGAGLGLALAQLGSRALITQIATATTPVTVDLTPDMRVLGFTMAVTIGTALLFGIAPALRASRTDPTEALKASGRTLALGGRLAGADVLVALQIALSLVLVVAAGLLVRTFATLTTQPLGFDADRLLSVGLQLPGGVPADRLPGIYEEARARAAAVPGVASAALSLVTPMSGLARRLDFQPKDGPQVPEPTIAFVNCVSPEWFRTIGMPVVAGRGFTEVDRVGAPNVVIVNDAFVRTFFGGANPLGRAIIQSPTREATLMTVIGLVPNSYYRSLRETIQPIAYVPVAQASSMPNVALTVRAAGGPTSALVRPVSAAVAQDRRLRVVTTTYRDQIAGTLRQERLVAWLSGSLGGIALALAALGLYAVTMYSVQARRHELGIRLMLGSAANGLVWLTLKRVGVLIGSGLVGGTIATLWACRFIATLLFGVQPRDLGTVAAAAALLTLVGLIAAWRPVRSATRIDPVEVLRHG
jgi:putative ABC transport system permease protein